MRTAVSVCVLCVGAAMPAMLLLLLCLWSPPQSLSCTMQHAAFKLLSVCDVCRCGDAGYALAAASRLAAQQGSLAAVPAWALMPSSLQRHWIR
jgi:hypothetical protein